MAIKPYHQNQLHLIPHTFDDLIPEQHPVRLVNNVWDNIDSSVLVKAYDESGRPSYHPLLMLKIMVYAYITNTYSSRKIEKRKWRRIKVEPVFWHIKHNRGFKRFTLRAKRKVNLELGLHALAHNMLKMAA